MLWFWDSVTKVNCPKLFILVFVKASDYYFEEQDKLAFPWNYFSMLKSSNSWAF
jgi:hypothetical protein